MKRIYVFLIGMVCGGFLTFAVLFFIGLKRSNPNNVEGLTLFEEVGDCISTESFKVLQVLKSGDALALEMKQDEEFGRSIPTGVAVLFLHDKAQSYYDQQIITIPSGKCARQVGTYRYINNDNIEKTVPVVIIR